MKKMNSLVALMALVLMGAASAQAIDWDAGGGTDTDFGQPLNWGGDVVPAGEVFANMGLGGIVTYTDDTGYQRMDDADIFGGTVFNMTGGELYVSRSSQYARFSIGNNTPGTVNQSGGTNQCGHLMRIGQSTTGDYNLTGGFLNVSRGGNSLQGSPFSPSLSIGPGSGAGTLNIMGGRVTTRAGVEIGPNAVFAVYGSGASEIGIGSNQSGDGAWRQINGSTLKVGINYNGVTKIFVDDVDVATNQVAIFESGSLLDVDYYGAGNGAGTWTVLELENGAISNNGLAFAAGVDTGVWSFNIDNSGANGLLTVTAVGADPVRSSDVTWTGTLNSDWNNALNWDNLMGLIQADTAFINSGAVEYSSGTSAALNAIKMKEGTLTISGGDLRVANNSNRESAVGTENGKTAVVNQTGGTATINTLEVGRTAGAAGVYNLSEGTLNASRAAGGSSVYIGANRSAGNSGEGTLTVSGGSLITRVGVKLGDATASGTGTFEVLGSEATQIGIGSSGSLDGSWEQYAGSTLKVAMDLRGLTKIFVDDYEEDGGTYVTFASGALLDVGYYNGGYGGGTWTVMEVENGDITDHGLAFAPGVDTDVWSFNIDNSGANGKLTVTATGDPATLPTDVYLTISDTKNQMMRYGLDFERLWYWYGSGLGDVPKWSVTDCDVDYLRCAMNSGYELTEGVYDLSAYTKKIIPMMTAMQNENPNIKWFASPRPLDEAVSGASWQPYPLWVTGASSYTAGDYDFNPTKCAEYMIRYLLLMKSYGFKITYMDLTNEWQTDYASGGRFAPDDAVVIKQVFTDYLTSPWPHPALDSNLLLEAEDFPLMIGASSWNYSQGASWISKFTSDERRNAIDIASSHNTDKTGSAQQFADAAKVALGNDVEIWETEQHGWKSTSGANEVTSFSYMIESIRAGFSGISGWLAIGTTSQGHSYLLNNGTTVTRNVKYYIFNKLSNTSNFGRALDTDQPAEFESTTALVRENLLSIWVNNTSDLEQVAEFDMGNRTIANPVVTVTRWSEEIAVEGISETVTALTDSSVQALIEPNSLYCLEVQLVPSGSDFPFLEAENYTAMSGVSVQTCTDVGGGEMVAFSDANDEISFKVDVTRRGSYDIAFRVAAASENIQFELLDGADVIATVDRVATGGDQSWTTIYKTVYLETGSTTLKFRATGGGWNLNWIEANDVFIPSDEVENIALGQTYSASNVYQDDPTYGADKAFDGDRGTRWATSEAPVWLEVDFGTPTSVNGVLFVEYGDRTTAYEIQYFDGSWKTAFVGGNPTDDLIYGFPTVTGTKFRYQSVASSGGPSIYELEFYYNPYYTDSDPTIGSMSIDSDSLSLSWSGVPGSTYAVQYTTNLVSGFTTIESGIPALEETNNAAMAMPDDAAFYRVILERD